MLRNDEQTQVMCEVCPAHLCGCFLPRESAVRSRNLGKCVTLLFCACSALRRVNATDVFLHPAEMPFLSPHETFPLLLVSEKLHALSCFIAQFSAFFLFFFLCRRLQLQGASLQCWFAFCRRKPQKRHLLLQP